MDHPTTQADLHARVSDTFGQIAAALARLSDAQQEQPGAENDWSVKDILAHVAFWHNRMASLVEAVLRAEPPTSLRQPGEDGAAAVDRVNAENYALNRDRPLAEVRAEFDAAYARALAVIGCLGDADLPDDSAVSQRLGGSLSELIAGDTYEHYDEHLPAIQALAART